MACTRNLVRSAALGLLAFATLAWWVPASAQTPEWNGQVELKHLDASTGKKMVLAGANMRVGVSLERLILLSGQGDAEKVAREAVELLLEKFKTAGLDVEGPQVVVAAPFYVNAKWDAQTTVTSESQNGGLFKKAYYYGIYKTAVMGMKYRDTETFTKARELIGASSVVELNMALVNDKTNFSVLGLSATLWRRYKDSSNEYPAYTATLKNTGDFKVASVGKDTMAYWLAIKSQTPIANFETATPARLPG
ncbi:hypothetical protein [Rhodoferax sp. GW822-FHT02A01]|uniref:hypothetical protein n=1 Tax=Rhodoferax sp. GW822-FHT02A01 TaxID=3141537 RepID=UPI00315D18A7